MTAEVFAAALRDAWRYRPGVRPARAWLYGIGAHKLADSRRRGRVEDEARRRLALEPLVLLDRDLDGIADLGLRGASAEVTDALETLPTTHRTAVLARIVDDRSYADIASQMQCSEFVVRQRVSRGLRALRARMKEST